MAVSRRILRPYLLIANVEERPLETSNTRFEPVDEDVVDVAGLGGRVIFDTTAFARGILVEEAAVEGGLERGWSQVCIRLRRAMGGNALSQLGGEGLGNRLSDDIDDFIPEELAGAGGLNVTQQLHEGPALRVVGQNRSLGGIVPERAQFPSTGNGRTVAILGGNGGWERRVVGEIDGAHEGRGNRDGPARGREGLLGPEDLAGCLHGGAGNDIDGVGQGIIKLPDGDLVGVATADPGIPPPPGDLNRTRDRGKHLAGVGTEIIQRRGGCAVRVGLGLPVPGGGGGQQDAVFVGRWGRNDGSKLQGEGLRKGRAAGLRRPEHHDDLTAAIAGGASGQVEICSGGVSLKRLAWLQGGIGLGDDDSPVGDDALKLVGRAADRSTAIGRRRGGACPLARDATKRTQVDAVLVLGGVEDGVLVDLRHIGDDGKPPTCQDGKDGP